MALQTAVLAAMVAAKQWTLITGTPVVLETRPIDPRSLFRGDYVRFDYAIGRLSANLPGATDDFWPHDKIYVLLVKDEPYWRPVSLHRERPAAPPDHVVIKGRFSYGGGTASGGRRATDVHVEYGIEDYFVPEGEGRALERPAPDEKITVRVAVDRYGNPGIQAILVNGKERYVEKLF